MRPIHVADLDKRRPVLVLTRELVRPAMRRVTVAPITSQQRGLATEVPVGPENGLEASGVVSCDNIVTVPADALGRVIGFLLPSQEPDLTEAILAAFDLFARPDVMAGVIRAGMETDFSWQASGRKYEELYEHLLEDLHA